MGSTLIVNAWVPSQNDSSTYEWVCVYAGESFIKAALRMRKAKKIAGLVKLEWRGYV